MAQKDTQQLILPNSKSKIKGVQRTKGEGCVCAWNSSEARLFIFSLNRAIPKESGIPSLAGEGGLGRVGSSSNSQAAPRPFPGCPAVEEPQPKPKP